MKVSALLFVASSLLSCIISLLGDIALYQFYTAYFNDPAFDWRTFQLYRDSELAYYAVYFPLPSLTFYVFVLARLKLTFEDTHFAIPTLYFKLAGVIALISVSLYTWGALYDCFVFYYYPVDYSVDVHVSGFMKFCYYQTYVVDPVIRGSVVVLVNKRLFELITVQREDLTTLCRWP